MRASYLVAASGQSLYMGYSPTNLTICTGGSNVLADTPNMSMVEGPPSPNDTGTRKFHRHLYIADGSHYLRLDGHTGAVSDWDSFVGTDEVSGEAIAGLMPFETNLELTITGQSGGHPKVSGDHTADLVVGDEVALQDTTADEFYTIATLTFGGGETTITLTPAPALAAGGGTIARVRTRGRIMCQWRTRIVIAIGNLYFMAAVGDPRNWEYGPITTTVTQAVAGSASDAGTVGQNITALVPVSDDLLGIFCQDSLWFMRGDPADGGALDNLSRQIGCVGPDAWCFDSKNNLYVMGTDGLYRITPDGRSIEKVSDAKMDKTFSTLDRTINRVILQYDRQRMYVYIFVVKDTVGAENENSYVYDTRTEGILPIRLPDENGPTSALYFEADAANDRAVLLGGRDGYIRGFRNGRWSDRDTSADVAISSTVLIGPFAADPGSVILMDEGHATLGGLSGGVTAEVLIGQTAEQAATSTTPRIARVLTNVSSRFFRQRIAAQSLAVRLTHNTLDETWSYGGGYIKTVLSGKARKVT